MMPVKRKSINITPFIIIIILTLALHSHMRTPHVYNPHYRVADGKPYYATYSNGRVFIGDPTYLESIKSEITPQDIIVVDNRKDPTDPNMEVKTEEPIYDKEIREEIIELIQIYSYYRPSDWKRTISSMRLEWFSYNITFFLKHNLDFDANIEFKNSNEQKYYDVRILNRLFKL